MLIDKLNKKSINYYYSLIVHLVRRDFSLKYKRSYLGILWTILLPIAQLLVFVLIFQYLLILNIDAYPAFIFSGLLPWTWISNSLVNSCNLFIENKDLLMRPNFHPFVLIIVNTISNLLLYLIAMPVLIIILYFYGVSLTSIILLFPIYVLILGLFISGLSLIFATYNVFYSDTQHTVSIVLLLLFYLCPIFYSVEFLPAKYLFLYRLNPFASFIENFRDILIDSNNLGIIWMFYLFFISLVVFYIGFKIYKKNLSFVYDKI